METENPDGSPEESSIEPDLQQRVDVGDALNAAGMTDVHVLDMQTVARLSEAAADLLEELATEGSAPVDRQPEGALRELTRADLLIIENGVVSLKHEHTLAVLGDN